MADSLFVFLPNHLGSEIIDNARVPPTCPVCLDSLTEKSIRLLVPADASKQCAHKMCITCIGKLTDSRCPVCREPLKRLTPTVPAYIAPTYSRVPTYSHVPTYNPSPARHIPDPVMPSPTYTNVGQHAVVLYYQTTTVRNTVHTPGPPVPSPFAKGNAMATGAIYHYRAYFTYVDTDYWSHKDFIINPRTGYMIQLDGDTCKKVCQARGIDIERIKEYIENPALAPAQRSSGVTFVPTPAPRAISVIVASLPVPRRLPSPEPPTAAPAPPIIKVRAKPKQLPPA